MGFLDFLKWVMTGEVATKVERLALSASKGNVVAQLNLGLCYAEGDGVPSDNREAIKWFLMAARKSDANSQFRLSEMYLNGDGVDKDVIAAYAWLSLSIGNGANKRGVRDNLERNMTKTQVEEAKGMADSLGASFE